MKAGRALFSGNVTEKETEMPLALNPGTGNYNAYIKFNGNSGRWYTKNEAGEEFEVANMRAIFDLSTIKCGWILFAEGQAPDAVWDTGPTAGPKPSDKHRRGFWVNVFSPKELGGLREFMANSDSAQLAIMDLYKKYEDAPEAKQGALPVVKCVSVTPVKSKYGMLYKPEFAIEKWVERPAAFDKAPSSGAGGGGATASNGANAAPKADPEVPPPQRKPAAAAPAAATADAEEF